MYQLLKKQFEIPVLGKILKYDQLSYREAVEFDHYMKSNGITIKEWSSVYIQQKLGLNAKDIKKIDLLLFFETYCDTALKGFYSKSTPKQGDSSIKSIPSSYITWLSSQMNIDPISLIERYTPEAINFCSDGIIWNENEKTPKGKEINARKLQAMNVLEGDNERDLMEIKEMRELREKKRALQSNDDKGQQ